MANHTITVINQGGGHVNSQTQIVGNSNKKTSSSTHFKQKQSNMGKKILSGIRIGRNLNVGSAIGLLGNGASMAVAVAQETLNTTKKGVDMYANFMEAKSGETMRYGNLKSKMGIIANPTGFLKTAIWDYGLLESQKVVRQNEMLNYDRQLTGSLILAKNYSNGTF